MSTRHPGRPKREEPWPPCRAASEGCSATTEGGSKGFCHKHYIYARRGLTDWDTGKQLRPLLRSSVRKPRAPVPRRPRLRKERWVGREGYVLVQAPSGHPRARQDGTILEHRLVMEFALGRFLEEWEIVHHKDGNRRHNIWENLELLDGRAKNGSEAHPPGHEFDPAAALQVVLQQDLPVHLRLLLLEYRRASRPSSEV